MSGVSIVSGDRGEGVSTFEFSMLDQAVPYPFDMAGLPTSTPNPGKARRKSRRSWFENTPKGFKFEIAVDKSELQEPVRRKSENMEVLTLTHFTAPPRLGFGTLKLGQERMCTLMLRNPHDYEQSVKVEKVPEKKNFTVNCREVVVGPNDSFPLEITWVPKDVGGCREMVLMQIDNSYRLQAYVFGTVTEPPKKKKTAGKRTGLLASKASRPFSVIQTSSLANIDHAYSPEKKPTRPGSRGAQHTQDSRARKPAVTVGVKGVGQNSKPGRKSVGKKSEEGRRRSSRNSGQFRESETVDNNDENVDPVEVERHVKRSSEEGPQGTITKSKPGSVVPRKKMRRSNTYSNVSGNLGLVVPIIHNDQVLGLKDTSLINIDDCNISGIQVLEQSIDHLNAEPSFLETTVEPKSNCPNPSFIKKIETKSEDTVAFSAPKSHSNSKENKQDQIILDEREDPSFLVPTKNVLTQKHLNDSLQDSLEMDGNQENVSPADEPSFLKPEFRSQNIRRKSLRRSGRFNSSEEPTEVRLLRSAKRNSSRPVDNDGHIVKAKKRRSSSEGSAVLKQLKNLKSFIHNKSLEIESSGNESGLAERLESEVAKCVERRETFVKTRTSPRFSMPAAESFRRGTFVTGSAKMKMLDEQEPSEASPRRTTFTVLKGGNKKTDMAGGKRLESKLVEEDEQTENDALHKIDEALKANENSSEKPDADKRPKMERMYSADSLENEDSLEEKFGSPNKILAAPTEEFSRRATLTVTKSRPSDALLYHHIHKGGVHTSLFKPDCIQEEIAASDKTDGNRSSQNSTFEVSADKSILLKDANFQATPNHLPTSPNPNHTRRSTHVVYQPKVLNLSHVAGKQLFNVDDEPSFLQANSDNEKHAVMEPSFLEEKKESCERIPAEKKVDEHVDDNVIHASESNELDKLDKEGTQKEEKLDKSENDQAVENSLHVSQLGDPVMPNEDDEHGDVFSPPSANTRRRTLSARRSVGAKSVHNLSMEEIKDKFTAVDKVNTEVIESKITATDAEDKTEGGLFFIPMNDSGPKQEAPAKKPMVKPDPKRFLKKRSNPVSQEVDVRTKRVCSESSAPLRSSVSARPVPKSMLSATRNVTSTGSSVTSGLVSKANTTRVVSRGPIKSTGNSGAGRQPMKPRLAASKGLSQSVLILSKKTKSVIPKHPLAFAAKNMYYDERWMEKQERGFVNWLNFILTPADEVQGSDVKVKVDAGKLTLELEKGRGKLAPTNEILSFRTYSAHRKLNRLRKSACRLFQSDAIRQVIHKLEREVESRRLLVRKDKMIHADLGAKQRLLDMLLSYNPLWLRVGLETIYGEVVPLQSNSDVYGLSRFIITRLLTSPDIAQEYSHPTVPHLYRDGYGEASAQHTLKKFLMLVYFLDQAKLQRIIDHNPCLFCKDSEYKASRDLLLQVSRDFLSGEGDINRHLGYLGYKVMYTQTALDEFDFAVKKLAIDLRDGVRLTRVVEMLCGRTDLSVQLRMPAISRLQKVHNIKLVFKALTDQNIDPGKSTPADIVEGHREKTLALLWAIILHYQVAVLINEEQLKEEVRLLERSLAVRQRLSRLAALKPVDGLNHRNSDAGDLHTQDDRLNLLLKWCRAVCAHFNLQIENFTVSFSDGRALCHIMHYYQPGLLPLAAIHNETTITHLADMERKCQQNLDCSFNDSASSATVFGDVEDPVIFEGLMNNEKENFKLLAEKVRELGGVPMMLHWGDMCNTIPDEKVVVTYLLHLCARLLDIRHESRAARVIQHAWRTYRLKKMEELYKEKGKAVVVLQRVVRTFLGRRRSQRQEKAAVCIQRVWRGHKARLEAARRRLEKAWQKQIVAVSLIQTAVKRYLHRRRYLQMKASVNEIQAYCKGYLYRQTRERAALTIQRVYRGFRARQHISKIEDAATRIQAFIRGCSARKMAREYLSAVGVVQARFRAQQAMGEQRRQYKKVRQSCITIQRFWRQLKITREMRDKFVSQRAAAVKIQSKVRMMLQRAKYQKLRSAAVTIQSHVRSFRVRKAFKVVLHHSHHAATVIQAAFRGYRVRMQLRVESAAATYIQACYRCYYMNKRWRKLREAAVACQRLYRAKLAGKRQREIYRSLRCAAITLQAQFRMIQCRRPYLEQKEAAVRIQSFYRCQSARQAYQKQRESACVIQTYFRAHIACKQQALEYHRLRCATIRIQSAVRCYLVRKQFMEMKNAAIRLQAVCRGYLFRKHRLEAVVTIQKSYRGYKVRKDVDRMNKAAVRIQTCFRRFIALRKFTAQKAAALVIQARYKAFAEMKKQQNSYEETKKACISIQRYWRQFDLARNVRNQFIRQREAAVKMQANVRRMIQRAKYQKLKAAAVIIQSHIRSHRVRKAFKVVLYHSQTSATTIQAAFRGYLVRKQMRKEHVAAAVIQACYRRFSQRRKYKSLCQSAIICQRLIRAKQTGQKQRIQFKTLRRATIVLQAQYRMVVCRRQFTQFKSAAVVTQSRVRGHLAQQSYNRLRKASIVLQKHWRAHLACKKQSDQYKELKSAVIVLQSSWRGHKARSQYVQLRASVVKIQAGCRGFLFRSRRQKAAVVIQTVYRGFRVRKELTNMSAAATRIQACFRRYRAVNVFVQYKQAATCIQRRYRAQISMKTQKSCFNSLRNSCIAVQRLWRAHLACKKQLDRYNKLKSAAIVLQSSWKGHKARSDYLQLRTSVVKIQAGCRGYLFRRRRQKAAVMIQTVFRGYIVRKEMMNMSAAATRIQAFFRRYRAVNLFSQYKQAVICIQRQYRGHVAMKSQKSRFNALRQSCVAVQRLWRANKASKSTRQSYLAQRCAAVKIQTNMRMMIQRSKYQRLRTAAIVIQSHIRSHRVRKAFKVVLCHSHHAATTLQAAFRGYLVRRQLRIESAAATYLQACYRCTAQRRRYCQLQNSAVVCQQRYRAKRECRKQFVLYSDLKKSAVTIQSQFRMIQCRREFIKSQAAAIKIQAWFRGTQDRAHFSKTRKAACVLQNYWRAELKCRRQFMAYHRLRDAVIALQSFHRGNMARKEVSRIRAAVKIQAFIRMNQARAQYSKYRHAALRIQGCVKVWQARKELNRLQQERSKVRESHLAKVVMVTRLNMAAIRIQRCYRNHCMMKIARERMHSILAIQHWMRAKLQRLQYLHTRQCVLRLQGSVRVWLARRDRAARVIQRSARSWLAGQQDCKRMKAAIKLQSLWRGHCVRRDSTSKKIATVRARVLEATATATEEKKLGNRTSSALDFLLKYKQISHVLDAVTHLEVATRLSWVCCERMVETNAIFVLYQLLRSCNRSIPHMEIIKYTLNVLTNLAKYEKTRTSVYEVEGSVSTLLELLTIYREKAQVFNSACTVLGILATDNKCKQNILSDKKSVEKLRSLHALTARKHKLEQNQRVTRARMNATLNSTFAIRSPVKKQKIKPEWSLQKDKLKEIENPLKAINFVLGNLGIPTKT